MAENQLHALVFQIVLYGLVDGLGFLRAQVPDGAVHQFQSCLNGPPPDLFHFLALLYSFHMLVRAEFQIDLICVVDHLLGKIFPDQRGQIPAHLTAEGEFAVGEGPGPGKTGGDMAERFAGHALSGLIFGAVSLLNGAAFFHNYDFLILFIPDQLQGCKDPRRSCTNDYNVILHKIPPFCLPTVSYYMGRKGPCQWPWVFRDFQLSLSWKMWYNHKEL